MKTYLLLGSNLLNKRQQISQSTKLILDNIGSFVAHSSLYETSSWGIKDLPSFINQVLVIDSELTPIVILEEVKKIERIMGRVERNKWGNREIDIDILFYGEEKIDHESLQIPHPLIQERLFCLVPLLEIAPDIIHPVLNQTIEELYDLCTDQEEVLLLEEL